MKAVMVFNNSVMGLPYYTFFEKTSKSGSVSIKEVTDCHKSSETTKMSDIKKFDSWNSGCHHPIGIVPFIFKKEIFEYLEADDMDKIQVIFRHVEGIKSDIAVLTLIE